LAGGYGDRGRKKIRRVDWKKQRNKWVPWKGHESLFTLLFNTVSIENELKCYFRKKMKFRCQIGNKKFNRVKKGSRF
jgi:hypothetical protein